MKEKTKYIMVFFILFLSAAFVVTNDIISSPLTIALWIVVMVGSLFLSDFKIDLQIFAIILFVSMWIILTGVINGENLATSIKIVFGIVAGGILASFLTLDEFARIFVRVMKFFMICSLVGYVLHLIVPGLFSLFIVRNSAGASFSNWFIYVQNIGSGSAASRNMGFAWEPGAFATFVCLSMMLEAFLPSTKITFKSLMLYLITILTTFSTTGIIAAMILTIYLLVCRGGFSKKEKQAVSACMVIMGVVMLSMSDVLFDVTKSSAFGKLIAYFNGTTAGKTTSVSVRMNSITEVFKAIFREPLFGYGYTGLNKELYEYTYNMNTCTFLNWFAVYGIIFGVVVMGGIMKFTHKFSTTRFNQWFMFFYLFLITMTENYVNSAMFFLIVMIGYKLKPEHSRVPAGGGTTK